ncbi:unnamed protein product [Clonostachys rosea]|uniref:Carrier domain-containing protein n=1 Tax=Bionectria ochroleuca TaxID=29856 RepID=A0ABY6UNG0_BIOOC|nr:unnamed protein product [Clonostachys rosea]
MIPPPASQNLWNLLQRAASESPTCGLAFVGDISSAPEIQITYPELVRIAATNCRRLLSRGLVKPNQVVLLSFPTHQENVTWIWSIIAAGGIPAALPPASEEATAQTAREEHLVNLFGNALLLTSLSGSRTAGYRKGLRIIDVDTLDSMGEGNLPIPGGTADGSDTALLFFTSGSTGQPKAIEITHKQIIASAQAKQHLHCTTNTTNFMNWVSYDHSACFAEIHVHSILAGASQWNVSYSVIMSEPSNLYKLMSRLKIGYTFTPCSVLWAATRATLDQKTSIKLDLSLLKVVMVGGEANNVSNLHKASSLMMAFGAKDNPIKAAYGLSETCSACFYNMEKAGYDISRNAQFASVGKHLPDVMTVRLVDESDQLVSRGSQGRIQMMGDVVFKRYYNDLEATAACMSSDGWFDTGDLGRLDEDGNLEIVGRIKDILILNGNKYSPSALEHTIETKYSSMVTSSYTAAFVVTDSDPHSEGLVILFNPTDSIFAQTPELQDLLKSLSQTCLQFCSKLPVDVIPLPRRMLPKSTIGKLSRSALRLQYMNGDFDAYRVFTSASREGLQLESPLAKRIAYNISKMTGVPISAMDQSTSITHKGLDSLHYMSMQHDLAQFVGTQKSIPLRLLFEASSIGDLEVSLTSFLDSPNEYTCCVTLREAGSQTPIFCIHAGDGVVTHFLPLLDYLPDRPFYAFQAKGRSPGEGLFGSMDEMVTCYHTALRKKQPNGPYILLGYCFGGVVAFELAKQLEADGHKVAFCGGLDSTPRPHLQESTSWTARNFVVDLMLLLGLIREDELPQLRDALGDAPDDRLDIGYSILESKYKSAAFLNSGLSSSKIELWRNLHTSMLRMSKNTELTGTIGTYDSFYVVNGDLTNGPEWLSSVNEWAEFARESAMWQVQGTHYTALKEPHVEYFSHCLQKALLRANV